jgi:NitT/TauT family transport system ATP-binding protein
MSKAQPIPNVPPPPPVILCARNVSKTFKGARDNTTVALRDVNLEVSEGEFVVLLGPSGCGKTTLLRLAAGLERPSSGELSRFGGPVNGPSTQAALMFQSSVLLPWRNTLKNVLLPAEVRGRVDEATRERAQQLLASTGLADFVDHYPATLSGGMRQRVALCRALLLDPPLLFMDEPFGALDAITRSHLNAELGRIWRATGKTIVFVTHDIAEAARLGTKVVLMSPRPGRVAAINDVEIDADTYEDRIANPAFGKYVQKLEIQVAALSG